VEELESRTLLSVFPPFTPAQIRTAYGINKIVLPKVISADGAGQTIALVDAYYDPTIQTDLAAFNKKFNLAPLDGKNGDGTFYQVDLSNQTQSPSGDDWTLEQALDVEWAHAIAPKANIVLVEAASDTQISDLNDPNYGEPVDLLNAVQAGASGVYPSSATVYTQAGQQPPGFVVPAAQTISMSWGVTEVPAEVNWDTKFFDTPGKTFVAASGDSGAGTIWPSVSPDVVSVGGTTLKLTSSNTIASEVGWGNGVWSPFFGGSGGGFSQYEPLPTFQDNISTVQGGYKLTSFKARLNPDVAFDADPNSGLYVVNGGAAYQVGGTSAGSPAWAAMIAIADQGRVANGLQPLSSTDTLGYLYTSSASSFHDITSGNTGTYDVLGTNGNVIGTISVSAVKGYDMVTGLGSPVANVLIPSLAKAGAASGSASTASKTSGASSSSSSSASSQDISAGPVDPPTSPTTPSTPPTTSSPTMLSSQVAMALTNANALRPATAQTTQPTAVSIAAPVPAQPISPTMAPLGSPVRLRLEGGSQTPSLLANEEQMPPPVETDDPAIDLPALDLWIPLTGDATLPPLAQLDDAPAMDDVDGLVQDEQLTSDDSFPALEPAAAVYGLAIALTMNCQAHACREEERKVRR
jgi:hypothetical protein